MRYSPAWESPSSWAFFRFLMASSLFPFSFWSRPKKKVAVSIFRSQLYAMGGCANSFIITLYTQVETCPFCKICRLFRSQVTGAGNIKQGWLPHAQLGFALVTGVEEGWRNRTGNGIVHIIILNSAAEFTLLLQKFSTSQINNSQPFRSCFQRLPHYRAKPQSPWLEP